MLFTTLLALAAATVVEGFPLSNSPSVDAAPPTCASGLNYTYYYSPFNYGFSNPNFNLSYFSSQTPLYTGLVSDVNSWVTPNWPNGGTTCTLPCTTTQVDCSQAAVFMQGFFNASAPGLYTFTTNNTVDNAIYFWSGPKALNGYTLSNEDYNATRSGSGPTIIPGSFAVQLSAFQLLPVTIVWVNGGGPGNAPLTITTPDGYVHTNTSGFFYSASPFSLP